MRFSACLVVMAAILMAFASGVCFGAEGDAAASVFFPETRYEFSPVLEDTKVVHDFVIQNKGDATLQVQRVKTG
ncbi:MAG: hypothetical protein JRH12_10185 [Deltaproteobacteria bacterium]|jgi:hypothetical protein|nr:hypothetical protein [Deltaproteobacteria bacterium]MBW2482483.1 hypothetical protein [Deltaproteobacteria bacterium]